MQISYKPLWRLLLEKNISFFQFSIDLIIVGSFFLMSTFYQKEIVLTNVRIKIYKKEIKPVKVLSPEISILLFFEFAIKIRIVKI